MLQWMQPSWLWALGAVVLPILIHYLSLRRAKEVWVGSLQLFEEGKSKQFRRFRLQDWLRLLLRVLFVACLPIALAQPVWQLHTSASGRAYLLLMPDLLDTTTYDPVVLQHLLDSLQNTSDLEARLLVEGLPLYDSSLSKDTVMAAAWSSYASCWYVLDSLARFRKVHVLAGFQAKYWQEELNPISKRVYWQWLSPRYHSKGEGIWQLSAAYTDQGLMPVYQIFYANGVATDTAAWRRFFDEKIGASILYHRMDDPEHTAYYTTSPNQLWLLPFDNLWQHIYLDTDMRIWVAGNPARWDESEQMRLIDLLAQQARWYALQPMALVSVSPENLQLHSDNNTKQKAGFVSKALSKSVVLMAIFFCLLDLCWMLYEQRRRNTLV